MVNTSMKSFLIILGTLIIGLILGALITVTVIKQIGRPPVQTEDAQTRMRNMIYRVTDATKEQKGKIDAVLDNQKAAFLEMEANHHLERKAFLDQTISEVKVFLEPNQVQRLEEKIESFRNREPKGRRGKNRRNRN